MSLEQAHTEHFSRIDVRLAGHDDQLSCIQRTLNGVEKILAAQEVMNRNMETSMTRYAENHDVDNLGKSLARIERKLDDLSARVDELESRPVRRYDQVVAVVTTAVVTFLVTYMITTFIGG